MLEYALMGSVIALVALVGVELVGDSTRDTFEEASGTVAGIINPGQNQQPNPFGGN